MAFLRDFLPINPQELTTELQSLNDSGSSWGYMSPSMMPWSSSIYETYFSGNGEGDVLMLLNDWSSASAHSDVRENPPRSSDLSMSTNNYAPFFPFTVSVPPPFICSSTLDGFQTPSYTSVDSFQTPSYIIYNLHSFQSCYKIFR